MLKWLLSKCSKCKVRFKRLVRSYRERKVSLPRFREAECHNQEWAEELARNHLYRDLLAWVAQQRDLRISRIVSTKREEDLRELRGEIRAVEKVYKYLSSYLED